MTKFRLDIVLVLVFSWIPLPALLRANEDRPNVLMIVVDDMNDWVGCLGAHPQVKTPNIDRLAARGMLFSNAHVPAPVCNPCRVSVLTGRNPSSTGIYANNVVWHQAFPGITSIPGYFRANGYHVVGGGKVNHHTPGFNRYDDWDEYFDQVFDSHYQTELAEKGKVKSFRWPPGFPLNQIDSVRLLSKPPQNANEFDWGPFDVGDDEMGDGKMVQWAKQFLAAPPRTPFFLAAGIYRPHLPFYSPRKYFEMYPLDQIVPPVIKEDDLDDLPAGGLAMAADRRGDYELVLREGKYLELLQAYLASISYADALIGQLLDALDASPAANNTIVIFWSDHGWHLGEKQHLHKFTLWERSTRIPMIIVAPEHTQPNSRTDKPVSAIDLFPTLNELCYLPSVPGLDGSSLVPLLKDPTTPQRRPALTTHGYKNHALRSERWRYIRYADGGEELYDHEQDPHEWNNLADFAGYAAIKSELAEWLPQVNIEPLAATDRKSRRQD
jgi:arylsulfatase A-like enzyme